MRGNLEIVIGAKKLYEAALRDVDKDFKAAGSNIGTYIKAGSAVAAAALATMTYAMYKAVEASTALNREMANTATLIPGNAARIRELKGDVQLLSIELGGSTEDLAGGLYQVISAFGDAADSTDKLRIAATAAKAGLSSTTESLSLLSSVTKGYGDTTAGALEHASDLAFTAVRLGQTTFPELAASMGKVVPVAAKLNVSQEELFAGFATLTGVTGQTAEVSTQYAAILRGMMKPTEGMKGAIDKLGFSSSEAMLKELGFIDSLKALIGTTDGTSSAVAKLFESGEALPALFALTGSQAGAYAQKLREMKTASGATQEAFKEQTTGINEFEFAVGQLKATWNVFYQRLGDFITQNPSVLNAIGSITTALKEFARIVGLDVRSETENLAHEIDQLARFAAAGGFGFNDGSFAAKRFAGFVQQLTDKLEAEKTKTEAATVAQRAHNKALKDGAGDGGGTVISPASEEAQKQIDSIAIANQRLGASKAELMVMDALAFIQTKANNEQLERYNQLLLERQDKELALANTLGAPQEAQIAAYQEYLRQREEQARAQEQLSALGDSPGTLTPEDEFSQAWLGYQAQLDALSQYNTQKMSLMAQAGASQVQMEAAYSEMVIDQDKKKRDFQLAAASQAFGGMSNLMQNLTVLTGKEGGAAFKMMKGFAIAQTTIDTYKAAQGAYAAMAGIPVVGPSLGAAAAAAAVVAGLARVKQIASMEPGGTASGSTISAGGTANPSYSGGSPGAYPVPTREEPPAKPQLTIVIEHAELMGDEAMDKFALRLSERVEKYDVELIATRTA